MENRPGSSRPHLSFSPSCPNTRDTSHTLCGPAFASDLGQIHRKGEEGAFQSSARAGLSSKTRGRWRREAGGNPSCYVHTCFQHALVTAPSLCQGCFCSRPQAQGPPTPSNPSLLSVSLGIPKEDLGVCGGGLFLDFSLDKGARRNLIPEA